ncbi:PDZ superfamily, partial [Fusarium oxysporum f. sp. vasinfectum]
MVHSVLPGGPADGKLEGRDILITVNGEPVTDLPSLNTIFDENINNKVSIPVERSGRRLEREIAATFHDVSWHDAYRCRHSCYGVSISNTGHYLQPIDKGAIIQKVSYQATIDLAAFIEVIKRIPAGTRALIEFWHPVQQRVMSKVVTIDSGWLPSLKVFRRNAMTDKWDVEAYERLLSAVETKCNVISHVPSSRGTASTVAEIRSTSLAIICYDPNSVRVLAKSAKLSTEDISQGQEITFVGCDRSGQFVEDSTSKIAIIAQGTEYLTWYTSRPINIDVIEVETALSYECDTGFLIATDATVQGLWIAPEGPCPNKNRFGVDSRGIAAIAKNLSQGVDVSFWRLPLELRSVEITDVEAMGVSIEWIKKVLAEHTDRQMLMVKRTSSQVPHQFQVGDILLSLNGKLVTRPSDVIATDPEAIRDVLASREGSEITIRARAVPEHDFETTRLTAFRGLVVQKSHRIVRHSVEELPSEIWIASICSGSPAHWYGVHVMSFIIDVD